MLFFRKQSLESVPWNKLLLKLKYKKRLFITLRKIDSLFPCFYKQKYISSKISTYGSSSPEVFSRKTSLKNFGKGYKKTPVVGTFRTRMLSCEFSEQFFCITPLGGCFRICRDIELEKHNLIILGSRYQVLFNKINVFLRSVSSKLVI